MNKLFIIKNIMKKLTTEEFIEKARKVHGDRYDYSKVNYKTTHEKVVITCKKHGDFEQTPSSHLQGNGCPKCKREKLNKTQKATYDDIIKIFREIHGDKYAYQDNFDFENMHSKIKITCPIHGEFTQEINSHIRGRGCPKCSKKFMDTEYFIECSNKIHNNKYDYSLTEYKSPKEYVKIICSRHGVFYQSPTKHLSGHGCPYCKRSLLEEKVDVILTEMSIDHIPQKKFDWLGLQSLDFYLPKYNIAIECQGIQHFKPLEIFGGESGFINRKILDEKKLELCEQHSLPLYYINYNEDIENKISKILKIYDNKNYCCQ